MARALFIGRFQPLHNGHLEVIKEIKRKHDEIVIGIGSAYQAFTKENPFTSGERYEMILRALNEEGITGFYVVPIPDINRYNIWPEHVNTLCPRFDVVYTNSPLNILLFKNAGFEVKTTKIYKRSEYSGREIRHRIIKGESWHDLVPPSVIKFLEEIEGVERLRELAKDDYSYDQNKEDA